MTQNQECAKYLPGILRKDARRDAVLKMRTDARRNSFSGTRAQLCISHSHKTRFENKDFRLSVCFFGCFQIFFSSCQHGFFRLSASFFRLLLIFFSSSCHHLFVRILALIFRLSTCLLFRLWSCFFKAVSLFFSGCGMFSVTSF